MKAPKLLSSIFGVMNFRTVAGLAALLLLAIPVAPALGDEWPAARVRNVFSPNGEYFVRIVPGDGSVSTSSTGQFYALRKSDRSYRLVAEVALQNPVQPAYAKMTDEGYLVAFDDWGSIGRKTAVAFYGPQGKLIRTIDISELYSPDELRKLQSSKSTTVWRCDIYYSVKDGGGTMLYVAGNGGVSFLLDPKAGSFKRVVTSGACGPPVATFGD